MSASTCSLIREAIGTGSLWASEIIAKIHKRHGVVVPARRISAMVSDGALTATMDGGAKAYSVVVKPAVDRKEKERQRQVVRSAQRKEARRAAGVPERAPRNPKPRPLAAQVSDERQSSAGESVQDFLSRGGTIQVLPGFQSDGVHAPRRPQMHSPTRGLSA